jgi:hypothetical protein
VSEPPGDPDLLPTGRRRVHCLRRLAINSSGFVRQSAIRFGGSGVTDADSSKLPA